MPPTHFSLGHRDKTLTPRGESNTSRKIATKTKDYDNGDEGNEGGETTIQGTPTTTTAPNLSLFVVKVSRYSKNT